MKKSILLLILMISAAVANATTYRVKYDVQKQQSASFTVQVNSDRLVIGNNAFSLRRMGTITNSGLTFNSYAYGNRDGIFCVSTTSITVEKNMFSRLTGYIIMFDNKAYLADKIN